MLGEREITYSVKTRVKLAWEGDGALDGPFDANAGEGRDRRGGRRASVVVT